MEGATAAAAVVTMLAAGTMRAVAFDQPGAPEVLRVIDRFVGSPGTGEARIRVHAAAVHPADLAYRGGFMPATGDGPHVPGMAVAGVVDAAGDGSRWKPGDAVMAMTLPRSPFGGGYAAQVIAPDDTIARSPDGYDSALAATLPMNGLTALAALRLLDLPAGATLLVTGASGALAALAIPLAVAAGLTVIADADSTDDAGADRNWVTALGAHIVVPRGEGFAAAVAQVKPTGVDAVLDSALLNDALIPLVGDNGSIASLRGWGGDPGRGITVHPVGVPSEWHNGAALDALTALIEHGQLPPRPVRVFPIEDAPLAHRIVAAGGLRSGVVLDFRPHGGPGGQ